MSRGGFGCGGLGRGGRKALSEAQTQLTEAKAALATAEVQSPPSPSAVSPSELTHRGIRSAIQCNARLSIEAVSAPFTRIAALNPFTATARVPITSSSSYHFRNAFTADCSVNSIDSRGTLSTYGPIAHPSPRGTARVSDTASTCRYSPPSRSS